MMQTKAHSLIESCTNTAIGYVVAILSQLAIFPMFGIDIPLLDNLMIGAWFTGISIARGYLLRRWFTRRTECHNAVDLPSVRQDEYPADKPPLKACGPGGEVGLGWRERREAMRGVVSAKRRAAARKHADVKWTCVCGKACYGNGGKSSHRKSCVQYRRRLDAQDDLDMVEVAQHSLSM